MEFTEDVYDIFYFTCGIIHLIRSKMICLHSTIHFGLDLFAQDLTNDSQPIAFDSM